MSKYAQFQKRYLVQAKRIDTDEEWTEWTDVDDYEEALMHAQRARDDGYDARIVYNTERIEDEDQA